MSGETALVAFRPQRVEFRRGLGKALFVALLVGGIPGVATRLSTQAEDWPAAVMLLVNDGLILGPLAIGVSAYAGARWKRSGTGWLEQESPLSKLRAARLELLSLMLWSVLGYSITALVCFAPALVVGTWSGPDLPRTFAAFAGVAAQVVIGYFVGRVAPFRLTPPLLAAVSFSLVAVVQSAPNPDSLVFFLPVNTDSFDFYNRTRPMVSYYEVLWYSSCALVVTALWYIRSTWRLLAVAVLGASVAVAIGSARLVTSLGNRANQHGVFVAFDCQGSQPVICTHPATSRGQPVLRRKFRRSVSLLAGTPFAVARAEQRPRGLGSKPTPGSVGFGLDDRSATSLEEAYVEFAHNAITQRASCTTAGGLVAPGTSKDAATLIAAVGDRVAFGIDRTPSTFSASTEVNQAITKIRSMSDDDFRAWLQREGTAIRTCTVTTGAETRP